MSEIDIRTNNTAKVGTIRFADKETSGRFSCSQADVISKTEGGALRILESNNSDYVRINSKEHADNLIAALNKAKELGWLV